MDYKYIYQAQILIYDRPADHVEQSETYPSDKHVLITDEQYQFHLDNPQASMQEVWNMALTPPYIQTNEDISRQRQEAYKQRSDSYYLSWQKDLALGDEDKAIISKEKWLAECLAIENEYPYL